MLKQRSFEGLSKTRIVRELALFAEIVKKMVRKNPNQLFVCIQNLIKFCPSVLKIKMTVNNHSLDLVIIDVYTKFGH